MMTNHYIVREPMAGIEFLSQVHFRFDRPGAIHTHAQVQFLLVISGSMVMSANENEYALSVGDMAILPAKLPHTVPSNGSPTEVELLDLRIDARHRGELGRFVAETDWPAVVRASPHAACEEAAELHRAATTREGPARTAAVRRGVWAILALAAHATTNAIPSLADRRVAAAKQFMLSRLTEPIGAEDIADACALSVSQLNRLFRAHAGVAPAQHLRSMRIDRSRELLATSLLSVKEIAHACGFVCPNHFCRAFKSEVGLTPGDYRDRAGAR